jgi:hypothetical protein
MSCYVIRLSNGRFAQGDGTLRAEAAGTLTYLDSSDAQAVCDYWTAKKTVLDGVSHAGAVVVPVSSVMPAKLLGKPAFDILEDVRRERAHVAYHTALVQKYRDLGLEPPAWARRMGLVADD